MLRSTDTTRPAVFAGLLDELEAANPPVGPDDAWPIGVKSSQTAVNQCRWQLIMDSVWRISGKLTVPASCPFPLTSVALLSCGGVLLPPGVDSDWPGTGPRKSCGRRCGISFGACPAASMADGLLGCCHERRRAGLANSGACCGREVSDSRPWRSVNQEIASVLGLRCYPQTLSIRNSVS